MPDSEIEDRAHLIDVIADAIDDSMDMDWTSRDGARAVAKELIERHAIRFTEKEGQ